MHARRSCASARPANTAPSASNIAGVSALRFAGRSMVTSATPPARSRAMRPSAMAVGVEPLQPGLDESIDGGHEGFEIGVVTPPVAVAGEVVRLDGCELEAAERVEPRCAG